MTRALITAIALAVSLQAGSAVVAQEAFRVDGITIPVPSNLMPQWRIVKNKERWATDRGHRFHGDFERFVCRQFEFLPANAEQARAAQVVIT